MNGVLLLNGAFGVGKSTVARELAGVIPRARVFDPERIGWWLRRLPAWFPGSAAALCDYQDSVLWRRMTVRGIARNARQAWVVVPMCLTGHRDAIVAALASRDVRVVEVCLLASDATLAARLARRGLDRSSPEGRWVYPRAFAAAARHRAGGFGTAIATDRLAPRDVAAEVRALVP